MSEEAVLPPGRLVPRVVASESSLAAFTSKQLATELRARLRSGALQSPSDRHDEDAEGFAVLGRELQRRFDLDSDRFSRVNAAARVWAYWGGDPSRPTSMRDETVVEFGCGGRNPLSVMFLFVMLGVRRAIGVDLDGIEDVPEAVRALARCAGWLLTDPRLIVGDFPITREQVARNLAATSFDLARLHAGDPAGVDRSRLDLRHVSASRLDLGDGEVDLCCSTSFLEHVDDAEAVIAEMARVTKRGGRGAHAIDGLDHRAYTDSTVRPLDFLEARTDEPLIYGCNRLRPRSFAAIFERHGFEVLRVHEWRHVEVDHAARDRFIEPYRSMSIADLACTGATYWLRKR